MATIATLSSIQTKAKSKQGATYSNKQTSEAAWITFLK
jgi:hypothetical protein